MKAKRVFPYALPLCSLQIVAKPVDLAQLMEDIKPNFQYWMDNIISTKSQLSGFMPPTFAPPPSLQRRKLQVASNVLRYERSYPSNCHPLYYPSRNVKLKSRLRTKWSIIDCQCEETLKKQAVTLAKFQSKAKQQGAAIVSLTATVTKLEIEVEKIAPKSLQTLLIVLNYQCLTRKHGINRDLEKQKNNHLFN
jgi:hypothetical protein